jgi:hypothetical protein
MDAFAKVLPVFRSPSKVKDLNAYLTRTVVNISRSRIRRLMAERRAMHKAALSNGYSISRVSAVALDCIIVTLDRRMAPAGRVSRESIVFYNIPVVNGYIFRVKPLVE